MTSYKWENPHAWLMEKAQSWSTEQLYCAVDSLANRLDTDAIQDLFQSEMEQDGYFDKTPERTEQ
jgi:hypothetical protein